jgi:2-C-methyl-D-erythritol 4-phosphate cytidylyltransferase
MPSFAVILPAAGQSSRFGGREKKPFVELDGRAVWLRAADLFRTRDDVKQVIVVVSPDDRELFDRRFAHTRLFMNVQVAGGGAERFESVANALARVETDVEFVAVHDAVRPLATPAQVDTVFRAAAEHGAALLALPVSDTVKQVNAEQVVTGTVPRQGLWLAQTPQVFRRDWLVEAYAKRGEFSQAITDDTQLVEALGHSVRVVPGSLSNLKITTQENLELATAILRVRRGEFAEQKPRRPFGDEEGWA